MFQKHNRFEQSIFFCFEQQSIAFNQSVYFIEISNNSFFVDSFVDLKHNT